MVEEDNQYVRTCLLVDAEDSPTRVSNMFQTCLPFPASGTKVADDDSRLSSLPSLIHKRSKLSRIDLLRIIMLASNSWNCLPVLLL